MVINTLHKVIPLFSSVHHLLCMTLRHIKGDNDFHCSHKKGGGGGGGNKGPIFSPNVFAM